MRIRRLVNEAEIIGLAQRNGFEVIYLECLAMADQLRLFLQASAIAGPLSASFANKVFAKLDTSVIELIGPQFQ